MAVRGTFIPILVIYALLAASAIPFTQAGSASASKSLHFKTAYDPDTFEEPTYGEADPTAAHDRTTRKANAPSTILHDPSGNVVNGAAHSAGSADNKPSHGRVPVLTILAMTCFMAAMSGLGAVPFFFCGKLKQSWAGISNAIACGVMLAASFDLLHEGAPYSPFMTITGMVLGAVFIKSSQEYLSQFEDASFEELSGADARKAMLIVGVMAAHAFGEGSGVGVSFSGQRGWAQGTLVTIAIGLHNIPEGMAVATVMVSKGASPSRALFWALFCGFPQALVAVPSYLFVETFQSLLPLALGFAAGCMVWIVAAELMPDALEAAPHPQVATAVTLSGAWLQGLSMMIATLEKPDGALYLPVKVEWVVLLIPALVVPVAAAAVAAGALPSLPAALGATTGVLGMLGVSCLGWLLLTGALPVLHTLLWAAAGGLAAALLWRNVLQPSPTLEVRRSLDEQLKAAQLQENGYKQELAPHADHFMDSRALVVGEGGAYMRGGVGTHQATAAAAGHLVDMSQPLQQNGHGSGPAPSGWLLNPAYPNTMGLQNGNAGYPHAPNGGMVAMQMQNSVPGTMQYHQHNAGPFENVAGYNGSANGAYHTAMQIPHATGDLHADQQRYQLPHKPPAVNTNDPYSSHLHPPLDGHAVVEDVRLQGGGLPVSRGSGQQGLGVRAALQGAVLLCCHAGCSMGLQAALALVAHGKEVHMGVWELLGHWLLPMALQGLPVGLACAGVGKALGGAGRWPAVCVALAACCAIPTAVLVSVANSPLDRPGADLIHWDGGWSQALQAAAAGALIAGSGWHVWPAAAASKRARALTGAVTGAVVVGGCQLLGVLLCTATPYCVK